MRWGGAVLGALGGVLLAVGGLAAQTPQPAPQAPGTPVPTTPAPAPATPAPATPPPAAQQLAQPATGSPAQPAQGTVLFQSHGEPPVTAPEPADPHRKLLPQAAPEPLSGAAAEQTADQAAEPELSDRERGALLFTAYDLNARIVPATARLTMHARVTVQNVSDAPLRRLALQVSSTLQWESVRVAQASGTQPVPMAQHLIDTDADHTGKANEAVLELDEPLQPGRSLTLDTFYSGTILRSAERLVRIGAGAIQAAAADWDVIGPDSRTGGVFLRGFGNVLWYPVSAPQMFLGEGARLFEAVDHAKLQEQAASVRLRLAAEYVGDPPTAAYFCGRRAAFAAISDAPDAAIATSTGVATAEFAPEPLGYRTPSLFVVARPEVLTAPLAGELAGGEPTLAVESRDAAAVSALGEAAERVTPLLQQWLGARPLSALTVLEAPSPYAGPLEEPQAPPVNAQPFQDGPLLVAPVEALTTSTAEPALTFSLAHAWVQSGRPWMDEGLAQFFALLQIEQAHGREAMVAQLGELMRPFAAADRAGPSSSSTSSASSASTSPALAPDPPSAGEPLIGAASEQFFRRKAAAVWLMLREIVGDQALQVTLQAWPMRQPGKTTAEQDALQLEAMLEKSSGQNLHRFFDDWVLHDRGLPNLNVAEVTPRQLSASTSTKNPGWLTVVTVTNAGAAMADVPLTVSSGSFSTTVRLVVPGAGSGGPESVTVRVQTESAPTEVQVNDGITPEMRTSVHRREVRSR